MGSVPQGHTKNRRNWRKVPGKNEEELQKNSRKIRGDPGRSGKIQRYTGKSKDIRGDPKISGEIQRYPRRSRDIRGNPGRFRRNSCRTPLKLR